MAKNVRWQIPFTSLQGIAYRIDIYDEGTFTPVQLTAGTSPFVTDEDNSDDFFHSVRSQTGTIQILTVKPDGGSITLDELLPANNVARPVRLVKLGTTNTTEWQGFLSCEAYSQKYTGIPNALALPVISVLEAMRSVYISKGTLQPLGSIGSMLARTLNAQTQVFNGFDRVFIPRRSINIFNILINTSALLTVDEIQNQEQMEYRIKGVDLHHIIEVLCTYMGWTAREHEDDLYLEEINGDNDMYAILTAALIYFDGINSDALVNTNHTDKDIASDLEWMGHNHKRDFVQGAHSVTVEANLEQFNVKTEIPELPYGNLLAERTVNMAPWYVFMLPSADDNAYSNLSFHHFKANIQMPGMDIIIGAYSTADAEDVIENSIPYAGSTSPAVLTYGNPSNTYLNYAGAFLARMQFDYLDYDPQHQSTQDGLYVSLFGGVWQEHTDYNPIFQMRGVQVFAAYEDGYINLKAATKQFLNSLGIGIDYDMKLQATLKVGNYNWTGSEWSTTNASHFFIEFDLEQKFKGNWDNTMGIDETDGLLIPITKDINGEIVFSIYPETKCTYNGTRIPQIYGIFFSELSVSFIPMKSIKRTDRRSNIYYMKLANNFRDDITVATDIVSWLHNSPSPSILFNPNNTPMQFMAYVENGQNKARRPEVDLLNRLAAYYGAARQRLELEVAHPTTAPLPLLKLNGINDGKTYLPLCESRDWRSDVCKLTCFELPAN